MTTLTVNRFVAGAALCCAIAVPALLPGAAHAQWVPGWRRGVVVAAPPVLVAPPPVAYVAPPPVIVARPYAHWVRPHFNWRGIWVPGHWA